MRENEQLLRDTFQFLGRTWRRAHHDSDGPQYYSTSLWPCARPSMLDCAALVAGATASAPPATCFVHAGPGSRIDVVLASRICKHALCDVGLVGDSGIPTHLPVAAVFQLVEYEQMVTKIVRRKKIELNFKDPEPFSLKFVCSEGPTVVRVMSLVSSHDLSLGRGAGARPSAARRCGGAGARRLRRSCRSCREPERELCTMWCLLGEWLGQPHRPYTKSDPTWGAEGLRWGGEVGGEKGPPLHRVDGALWRRRSQGIHGWDWERILNPCCDFGISAAFFCSLLRESSGKFGTIVSPASFSMLSVISLWSTMLLVQSEFGIVCGERQRSLDPPCRLSECVSSLSLPVPRAHFGAYLVLCTSWRHCCAVFLEVSVGRFFFFLNHHATGEFSTFAFRQSFSHLRGCDVLTHRATSV